jgi:hypothetical protein
MIFYCIFAQNTWIQTYNPIENSEEYQPINLLNYDNDFIFNYNCHIYDYDPEWPSDWYNSGIIKINSEGIITWEYITGYEYTNCIVITSDGETIGASSNYGSNYLFKLNFDGELVWTINLNDFQVWSLDNTIDGNVVLSGEIDSIPAIKKITSSGSEIWSQTYNINQYTTGRLYSIYATENGDYLASGKIYSNDTLDDALIIKSDENGELIFSRTLDGFNHQDKAYSAVENNNEEILIVGYCRENNNFNHLFWKLNSSGETIWIENSEIGFNSSVHYNQEYDNFLVAGSKIFIVEQENFEILTDDYNPGGYDKSIAILENNLVFFNHFSFFYITICKSDLNGIVSVNDDNIYYPNDYKLTNYPNPFNPNTTIEFLIKEDSNVSISIFNTKGQVVKNLVNKFYTNGNHSIEWNGVDENNNQVSSGIYYYSLCINGNTKVVKKCILLK